MDGGGKRFGAGDAPSGHNSAQMQGGANQPLRTGLQILASQSLNQPITMRVSYTYDNTVIGQ